MHRRQMHNDSCILQHNELLLPRDGVHKRIIGGIHSENLFATFDVQRKAYSWTVIPAKIL